MNTTHLQDLVRRHPLAFSALVVGTLLAIDLMLELGSVALSLELSVLITGGLSAALLSAVSVLAITRLGIWRELGLLGRPTRLRMLVWFLPFVVLGVLPWMTVTDLTPAVAAAVVAFGVLNAFWKLGFLGLLMYAWLPRGERFAVGVAAGVWGAMHLAGILFGARVIPTLVLAASYALLSCGFAGVWMRTRLLWPLVAAYALLEGSAVAIFRDSGASNLAPSAADLLPLSVSSLLLAGYGLLALPPRRRSEEPRLQGRVFGPPRTTSGHITVPGSVRTGRDVERRASSR